MSGCTQEDGLSRFQVPAELKFCEGATRGLGVVKLVP
jgi:hypothetical protein